MSLTICDSKVLVIAAMNPLRPRFYDDFSYAPIIPDDSTRIPRERFPQWNPSLVLFVFNFLFLSAIIMKTIKMMSEATAIQISDFRIFPFCP